MWNEPRPWVMARRMDPYEIISASGAIYASADALYMAVPHAWAGENIAWNTWDWSQTADVAVNMWYNSPPHMENIMDCHSRPGPPEPGRC